MGSYLIQPPAPLGTGQECLLYPHLAEILLIFKALVQMSPALGSLSDKVGCSLYRHPM